MTGIQLKRLDEVLTVPLAYREPVTAVQGVDIVPRELVEGGALVGVVAVVQGASITLTVDGGTDGERYIITVSASHGADPATDREIELAVLDPLWAMPDGTTAWLDIVEFVERFGLDEAVLATDVSSSGTIDRPYLIGALRDAQADAQIYVAARYALPLATVPGTLKTAVADLARARLYPRGLPDGVADNAKQAIKRLEQIAAGKLPLPIAQGETAEPAESDAPIVSWSTGRTYSDGLADY